MARPRTNRFPATRRRRSLAAVVLIGAAAAAAVSGTTASTARAAVSMPNPPFALDARLRTPLFGGIFDGAGDRQKIGVFLRHSGGKPLRRVVARASVPTDSQIVMTKAVQRWDVVRPGVPVLGLFEANFADVLAGKYLLTVRVSARGRLVDTVSRPLLVERSAPVSPNAWTGTTDVGQIALEVFSDFGGNNLGTLSLFTSSKWTVQYASPFLGQVGPIPYADPWWKVAGGWTMIVGGAGYIAGAITKACGAEKVGETIKDISTGVATVGAGMALLDVKDPFRRGQENTPPLGPEERTVREELTVQVNYPTNPMVGTRYPMNVSWQYTRFTETQGMPRSYTYEVSESLTNDHATSIRRTRLSDTSLTPGQRMVIRSKTNGRLDNNHGYFVAEIFRARDVNLGNPIKTVVLADDGTRADRRAGDAIFTGTAPAPRAAGRYRVYIFGYELDPVPADVAPEIAAQFISGFLVSTPQLGSSCAVSPSASFSVG